MSTLLDKLTDVQNIKDSFKSKIRGKGVNVLDGDPFRDYSTRIGEIVPGEPEVIIDTQALYDSIFVANDPTHPSDIIPFPAINSADDKIVYIVEICADDPVANAYGLVDGTVIDWGDGTSETFGVDEIFHTYNYSAITSTEVDGCKQVAITLTKGVGNDPLQPVYCFKYITIAMCANVPSSTSFAFSSLENLRYAELRNHSLTSFQRLFGYCEKLKKVKIDNSAGITNMDSMFQYCSSLETIPLIDTSSVTRFYAMFVNCSSLKTIPMLDTSSGTEFRNMFSGCSSLKMIPLLDTSNGTSLGSMFSSCISLETIPALDTSSCTYISSMFMGCSSLRYIPLLDTSSCVYISDMFKSCFSLKKIPLLDTSNNIYFDGMFQYCSSLETIPLLDTSKGTRFGEMFEYCTALTEIPLIDTSKGTDLSHMFQYCTALNSIPALDTSVNTTFNYTFGTNNALTHVYMSPILKSVDFGHSNNLSRKSIINIFNNLGTVTGQTVDLGNAPGADLLTQAEKDIAINKGWTVTG